MKKVEVTSNLFEKLLYRCQFILGPFFVEELESWKRIEIGNSTHLTVHPDLNTCQVVNKDKSITLLGFILDPDNPQASDADIVNGLLHELSSCDVFFEHTDKFGGRWILIVDDGQEMRLFNDATGLRQVFYTDIRYAKDVWCASQPRIIAEVLNLKMDEEAVDFVNSDEIRKNKEYWWPGDSSSYKEIKRLLPNHYLNLETGEYHRYWPNKPLDELPLDRAVEKISGTLQGLVKGASNRFDLALSLTAGWDSRLVLAACKEISHEISYMTVRQLDMSEDSCDIEVPSRLLSKLGFKHSIVEASSELNGEFIEAFKKSLPFAHDIWAPDAQAIFDYYHQNKVAAVGSVSEVARCFYHKSSPLEEYEITPQKLSSLSGMENHPFSIKSFERWLSRSGELYNLDVLDLFYWEQRAGSWLAMCQLEFGMAWQDIFTPYNCRSLLIDMLSVSEEHRRPPRFRLYKELILNLWPEVLCEPINPRAKKGLKHQVRLYVRSLKRKLLY